MEFFYQKIAMSQFPEVEHVFSKFIHEFDRIIEIGTYTGGFTLMLHDKKRPDTELISYDINSETCQIPKKYAINLRHGNVFSEEIKNEIKEMISYDKKRVLLLCDGGNKQLEFEIFCEVLKPIDVIMTHDYAEIFDEWMEYAYKRGWTSVLESSWDGLQKIIHKNHLSKFYPHYDELKKVLWGSFIKNKL